MDSFAGALDALMSERGVSASALARAVPCDRSLICRLRNGKQRPSARIAHLADKILGAGGELAALAREEPPTRRRVLAGGLAAGALASVEVREHLAWTARHPPRLDAGAVESLVDVLAAQRRADSELGSVVMLPPVLAQLATIEDLVRQARGPVRPALLSVAQQWAQLAAYQHRQLGDGAGDRHRLSQALEWATEIGDRTMTATVLLNRGEEALLACEAGTVIGLAQAVLADTSAAAGTRAHAADLEARGHGMAGDAGAAERCLDAAAVLTADLGAADTRHPWLHWVSQADMQCKRGVSLGFLAEDPRYRDRAVAELEAGYRALLPDERQTAWGAKYPAYLAAVHERAGDVEQACAIAVQVADIARRTGPSLAQRIVRQVHARLKARDPGDPRVAELTQALR